MSELEVETAMMLAALEAIVVSDADAAFWGLVGEARRGAEDELGRLVRAALGLTTFHREDDVNMKAFLRTVAA
jgi:hypothetical protein